MAEQHVEFIKMCWIKKPSTAKWAVSVFKCYLNVMIFKQLFVFTLLTLQFVSCLIRSTISYFSIVLNVHYKRNLVCSNAYPVLKLHWLNIEMLAAVFGNF